MKIAMCANWDIRDNGTFFLADHAMKQLAEEEGFETFRVRSPDDNPPKADLYIAIDDGRDDIDWIPPKPNVFWAIDTHLGYGFRMWKSRQFDKVFVAQEPAIRLLKRDGVTAEWLPLACSPDHNLDRDELIEKGYPGNQMVRNLDFCFVGFLNDPADKDKNNRVDYLDKLFSEYPNSWLATGVFFDQMCIRYARAQAAFNISIMNDLNMRVFEVMSCGVPLLTNADVIGIDMFKEGRDYHGFIGMEEMIFKARQLMMMDPKRRKELARRAQKTVRESHTYKHRMKAILEKVA